MSNGKVLQKKSYLDTKIWLKMETRVDAHLRIRGDSDFSFYEIVVGGDNLPNLNFCI